MKKWGPIIVASVVLCSIMVYNAPLAEGHNWDGFGQYYLDMANGKSAPAPYGCRVLGPAIASLFSDHMLGGYVVIAGSFAIGGILISWIISLLGLSTIYSWMAMLLYIFWYELTRIAANSFAVPDGLGMMFLLLSIALIMKGWLWSALIAILIGLTAKMTPLASAPLWLIIMWRHDRLKTLIGSALIMAMILVVKSGWMGELSPSIIPVEHSMGLWKDFLGVMAYKQNWDWFSWTFFFAPLCLLLPLFFIGAKNIKHEYLTLFAFPIVALFLATTIGRTMSMAAPILIIGAVYGLRGLTMHLQDGARNVVLFSVLSIHIMNLRSPYIIFLVVGMALLSMRIHREVATQ